jgi:SH3 domain protein
MPVEVTREDSGNGYTRVREPGGREGWVLSRFLSGQPGAQAQLLTTHQELAVLQTDKAQMIEQLKSIGALQGTIARLEAENQTLASELETFRATTANILSLDRDARDLESAIDNLVRRNESLLRDKFQLEDRAAPRWFVRGAGVLLLGLVLGLLFPRFRGKRKRHWGEL